MGIIKVWEYLPSIVWVIDSTLNWRLRFTYLYHFWLLLCLLFTLYVFIDRFFFILISLLNIPDIRLLGEILFFINIEPCDLIVKYVIFLFVFVTKSLKYSTQTLGIIYFYSGSHNLFNYFCSYLLLRGYGTEFLLKIWTFYLYSIELSIQNIESYIS